MLATLTILVHLLAADFDAQKSPHSSSGLTEAQVCNFTAETLPCFLKH